MAIVIVLRHCGQNFYTADSLYVTILNTVSPLGVPLFFAVSGFLFFQKDRNGFELKHYVIRLTKLYGIWTIIYLPLILWEMVKSGSNDTGLLIRRLVFDGSYYHLWFLPALIVAITIVYFLSKKVTDKVILIVAILLYVVGTLVDSYSFLSPLFVWKGYKAFFITTRNGVFFGTLFVLLGKMAGVKRKFNGVLTVIAMIAMVCEGWYLCIIHHTEIVNMMLSSMIMVPAIMALALCTSDYLTCIHGKYYRQVSTVLFCVHPYVIYVIGAIRRRIGLQSIIAVMIVVILSLEIAHIVVKMAGKLPLMKHLL